MEGMKIVNDYQAQFSKTSMFINDSCIMTSFLQRSQKLQNLCCFIFVPKVSGNQERNSVEIEKLILYESKLLEHLQDSNLEIKPLHI